MFKIRNAASNVKNSIKEHRIKYRILLLTNRDSDNVGDQVIEACDIALIQTVMKNLGLKEHEYYINSRAAAIINKKYLATKEDKYLKGARKSIQESDLVVFGGAPVFNYRYQNFYERTARTLELCKEYGKPAIFSAIGVESYNEGNAKCERLRSTLNFDIVKQITTRDGIEKLEKYKQRDDLVIGKVADPAVFTAEVMKNFKAEKKAEKKIGLFVLRANGFLDNGFDFSRDQSAQLWLDIIDELTARGYDYTLITSGHFGDEAFLDYMIRDRHISEKKTVFNMNCPEKLVKKISSYDGIISTRLHPNIISYSLQVPAVGITWNEKVTKFYESINYPDRVVRIDDVNAKDIVDRLEKSMAEGVDRDKDYLMTVYNSLFNGIKASFNIASDIKPYDFETLSQEMAQFEGTSADEKRKKVVRKFRRTYENYNKRYDKIQELQSKTPVGASCSFHSGSAKGEGLGLIEDWEKILAGSMADLKSGAKEIKANDTVTVFPESMYTNGDKEFAGWIIRFKMDDIWYWYLEDGSFMEKDIYIAGTSKRVKQFMPGEAFPVIRLNRITIFICEAKWK